MVGFDGTEVDSDHAVVRAIRDEHLGGVILFDRNVDGSRQNISSPEQLSRLTATLQGSTEIPLIIGVDQEGGRVRRLKEEDGFPPTVTATWLGKQNDLDASQRYADQIAEVQSACGINMNLAPVVDLDLNLNNPIIARYERSYAATTVEVVNQASVFIDAHHKQGIACCLKHFPGHGSGASDSHLGFVDITEHWQREELEPYRKLFASGFNDSVMTAHVVNRHLDPGGLPATLSEEIISSLLRNKLGFGGVVVSDDLQMKAISNRWSYEEAVQRAVLAGVDLIIVGNNLVREEDIVARGIRAVEELLRSGQIKKERVISSLDRIDVLKRKITGELPWTVKKPTA